MSRRRRRSSPRCRDCQAPVLFFRSARTGNWRPFDPKPVDQRQQNPSTAHAVENGVLAWPLRDLVEDLMVRRHCGRDDAEDEARAMPWHVPHDCPNRPAQNEETNR